MSINHLELHRPGRLPLPMSSGVNIPPGSSATIITRPQTAKFYPERLLIKEASHWQIDAICVGDRDHKLIQKQPGATFAATALGRFPGCGEIEIPSGKDLIVEMTYTGLKEAGIPFEACVFGSVDAPLPATPIARRGEKLIELAKSGLAVQQSVRLFTDPMQHDTWPCRLVIKDASDWIVNDIYVGEVSIFAQSGDIPGSMFSKSVESATCLGHLAVGDTFSVVATYVGTATEAELVYELYGTLDGAEAGNLPLATILPMSSGVSILPEKSAQITSRCQRPEGRRRGIGPKQGFLAERIIVEDACNWIFNDIKIGRTSQFAQSGDIPGLAFGPETLRGAVSFDIARAGIDVAIVTTHVGPREIGAPFSCGILGCLVDLTEVQPSSQRGRILSVHDLHKSRA